MRRIVAKNITMNPSSFDSNVVVNNVHDVNTIHPAKPIDISAKKANAVNSRMNLNSSTRKQNIVLNLSFMNNSKYKKGKSMPCSGIGNPRGLITDRTLQVSFEYRQILRFWNLTAGMLAS
jgi:hypothetical protein